jgi:predicted CoA-binding protein
MELKSISLSEAAEKFLGLPSFAVFGLSRGDDETAKIIYEKLKETGRTVYAIHPTERVIKGIPCWPSIKACPEHVEGVVIITRPEHTRAILEQSKMHGATWAWVHKSFGNSVDPSAVNVARQLGMQVIDGGCPMMFMAPIDGAHACLKHFLKWIGRIPTEIELSA